MPQKKNTRKPQKTQPKKTAKDHRRSNMQIFFLIVSAIIILSMLLSSIRF